MASNTQKKNLQIHSFHLMNGLKSTTCYLGKGLIEHVKSFVADGMWASRSEFVRAAIREKVIRTLEENELMAEWRKTKAFNNAQNREVIIDGIKHTVIRRCE